MHRALYREIKTIDSSRPYWFGGKIIGRVFARLQSSICRSDQINRNILTMPITTKQQRRSEAFQLIADGVPPTDAATQLSQTWGCSRRTSLKGIELAQSELANTLNSVALQQMVGWLATQYQHLAAKAERDGQHAAACGRLSSLRVMLVQPQLNRKFEAHFRGRFMHQRHRRA